MTYPTDGATSADMSQPIQWTTALSAQAYYLYVGSTLGAKDLVDTGEIQSTSYLAAGFTGGQMVFARLWTRISGTWISTDSSFTTSTATLPVVATLTSPVNGATNVSLTLPIQWTTVPNAQAYYLYVGSTPGANDLVNTGEIQPTSYLATGVPGNQIAFARLWTKFGGVWRFSDSSFTTSAATAPVVATLTSPVNGATNVDMTLPMQWTTVLNVQAYYLYVGSTLGANDLVNTGEIQPTSYLATGVPGNQIVFARLWTKFGGIWRFSDSSFTTSAATVPVVATLTSPVNGAANVDMTLPMQWTTVLNAQAYYLYVGSTLGSNDLVNTGEIQPTSYLATGLPGGQTVFARLWTEVGGIWRYVDSTFGAVSLTATLTYPLDRAVAIDQTKSANWTTIANDQAYYLYVGSTPGANDLTNSGEIHSTTFAMTRLPVGPTLFARIWTETAGVWRYRDSTFTAAATTPLFVFPADGTVAVDATQPFRWTSPPNANAQELRVGTSAGANDLFDSGQMVATTAVVNGLPTTGVVYARAMSSVNGTWHYMDIAFTLEAASPISSIVVPSDGQAVFDTVQPFQWSAVPLARGYRLIIGSTFGANDVHDSGEIHVTQRFVPALPIGLLYGRVSTELQGQWQANDFTFTVTANTASVAVQIQSALWATDVVRQMALADNIPFSWTLLASITPGMTANCFNYAEALLGVLAETNVQLPARSLDVALNPNGYDGHTLVEMFNSDSQNWMLLDPTFDLTVRRAADGNWATAEDMSSATRAEQWNNVSYVFLGGLGADYAHGYYLDYPLLFVDIYHTGQVPVNGQGGSVLPYMVSVPTPVSTQAVYAAGCAADLVTDLLISGVDRSIACNGVDGLSYVFSAGSIALTALTSASTIVYQPMRFVF